MTRKIFLPAMFFCAVLPALAFRPYGQKAAAKVSWMNVSALQTGKEYYMEISQDGQAMMRIETKKASITRRGIVSVQLAKDFFREIENSEILNFQDGAGNKMVFYRGEVLSISAYINGELRRVDAPLNTFGEAFSYAFGEAKKSIEKLPLDKKLYGFLIAEPIAGDELDQFREHASKEHEIKNIETYDIQKVKPLFEAIRQPYRLIPLQSQDDAKDIRSFISLNQLYGLRKLFYLPSTRGVFKCQVKEAGK
ncbi:MAG: hypothetical protein NTX59_05240 [Elusimicrobia bacterium]|nr:hypothetical protein [Elusimicrobiota bacterium]